MTTKSMSGKKPEQASGEVAIVAAAERLFAQYGYDAVSIRLIAREAGVSKANIYHHFDSKEALYQAILKSSTAETALLIEALAASGGDFDQRLADFAAAHLQHLFDRKNTAMMVLREAFSADEDRTRKLSQEVFDEITQRLVSIMRAGQEAGTLRAELDPAICVILLLGANVFYFQAQTLLKHFPEAKFARQSKLFSKGMADVLLNGMMNKSVSKNNKR